MCVCVCVSLVDHAGLYSSLWQAAQPRQVRKRYCMYAVVSRAHNRWSRFYLGQPICIFRCCGGRQATHRLLINISAAAAAAAAAAVHINIKVGDKLLSVNIKWKAETGSAGVVFFSVRAAATTTASGKNSFPRKQWQATFGLHRFPIDTPFSLPVPTHMAINTHYTCFRLILHKAGTGNLNSVSKT